MVLGLLGAVRHSPFDSGPLGQFVAWFPVRSGPQATGGASTSGSRDETATRFYDVILTPAITQAGLEPATPRRLEVSWHTLEAPQ